MKNAKLFFLSFLLYSNFTLAKFSTNCDVTNSINNTKNSLVHNIPHNFGIFLFTNSSNKTILIDWVLNKRRGLQAGFATRIDPGHVSALVLQRKNLTITCNKINEFLATNAHDWIPVSCYKVLKICRVKTPLFFKPTSPELSGDWWLMENVLPSQVEPKVRQFINKYYTE